MRLRLRRGHCPRGRRSPTCSRVLATSSRLAARTTIRCTSPTGGRHQSHAAASGAQCHFKNRGNKGRNMIESARNCLLLSSIRLAATQTPPSLRLNFFSLFSVSTARIDVVDDVCRVKRNFLCASLSSKQLFCYIKCVVLALISI